MVVLLHRTKRKTKGKGVRRVRDLSGEAGKNFKVKRRERKFYVGRIFELGCGQRVCGRCGSGRRLGGGTRRDGQRSDGGHRRAPGQGRIRRLPPGLAQKNEAAHGYLFGWFFFSDSEEDNFCEKKIMITDGAPFSLCGIQTKCLPMYHGVV